MTEIEFEIAFQRAVQVDIDIAHGEISRRSPNQVQRILQRLGLEEVCNNFLGITEVTEKDATH